jgi:hypothetical protein
MLEDLRSGLVMAQEVYRPFHSRSTELTYILGNYRTSDQTYYEAWEPWIKEINKVLVKNQITQGGPVILYQVENELQETVHEADNTLVIYMEQLKRVIKDSGIVVPLTSNEKGQRSQSWSTDYQDVGGLLTCDIVHNQMADSVPRLQVL